MAMLTVSGEPGCRAEEVARLAAHRLGFELFTESDLRRLAGEKFGPESLAPEKAYPYLIAAILATLATRHHLVACFSGAGFLLREYPAVVRAFLVAPPSYRAGMLMLEHHLERPRATAMLKRLDLESRQQRRRRFGRATAPPQLFDITLNAAGMDSEVMAAVLAAVATGRGLAEQGTMGPATEAAIQFRLRLQLAKYSIRPPGKVKLDRKAFVHPSEEIFANLLDFYQIAWEYEPKSFPLRWDENGKIREAFTPDFYLPEFDLYVELTTMKQALVTKKNHKIRMLRRIYPDVNIQVFYQKDIQNLIFKYGLAERTVQL